MDATTGGNPPDEGPAAIDDAELVRRYEAIRPLRRSGATDALRRAIEDRARRRLTVSDPRSGISYRWDDASESVVRERHDRAFVRARDAEMRRLRDLGGRLGRTALEAGAGRGY